MSNAGLDFRRIRPKHIPELDALRGIAALGIVIFHAHVNKLFWAWSLVDLFFILSGFLITRTLLDARPHGSELTRFWLSRIVRIWPVYYLVLAAVMLKYWIGQHLGSVPNGIPNNLIASLLFVQNYSFFWESTNGHIPGFDHSWSLAVEEQFYLIWPLVVLALRCRPKLLAAVCLAMIAAGVISRTFAGNPLLLFTRVDGLGVGSLLACLELVELRSAKQSKWSAIGIVIAVGVSTYVLTRYLNIVYAVSGDRSSLIYTVQWQALIAAFCVAYGILVWVMIRESGAPWLSFLRSKIFTYLASISFAVYMVHYPLLDLLHSQHVRYSIAWSGWSTITLLVVSIGSAHLIGRWVEAPMQSWKRRQLARAGT